MSPLKTPSLIPYCHFIKLIALGVAACLQPACNASCPKGYELHDNVCVLSVDGGTIDTNYINDSGPTEDVDAASGKCVDSTFNATCRAATDCGCDTGFCAAMPGQQGFCTHSGCLQDATICPTSWTCMDLTAYGQAGLSICTPP